MPQVSLRSVLVRTLLLVGPAACSGQIDGAATGGGDRGAPMSMPGARPEPGGGRPTPGMPIPGAPGSGGATPGTPAPGAPPAGDPGLPPSPSSPPPVTACKTNAPGPRLLRRLTSHEHAETLKDLFGSGVPIEKVLVDTAALGFHNDAARLVVQDLGAQQIMDHAEQVARWAVGGRLAQISPCQTHDAGCRQQFIRKFGRRAFRAPLSDAQVAAYETLAAAEATFADGAEVVIAAMLQSPSFLYRRELGASDPAIPGRFLLTPHEIAASLSYLLVGSMPDDQLAAAADAGMLSTPAQIDAHAERLLKDPRNGEALMRFAEGWLGLDHLFSKVKDDTVFKLTDTMRKDMLGETRGFFLYTFKQNGTLSDLLVENHSFLNRSLAEHYGIPGGSTELSRMSYPSAQRDPGILAHGSILTGYATASGSSPVARGKLVRTRLLCQTLPDPPGDVDTMLKPPQPNESTRERFKRHSDDPSCAGCHRLMDPIGFGFERYDGFGRRRETENGLPVDVSGTIYGLKEGDVPFSGVKALANQLAKSEEVKACFVRYWAYHAYGAASWAEDACTLEAIGQEAAKANYSLRGVLMAILHAPHFARRTQDK